MIKSYIDHCLTEDVSYLHKMKSQYPGTISWGTGASYQGGRLHAGELQTRQRRGGHGRVSGYAGGLALRTWQRWHHHMALSLMAVRFLIGETHRGQQWTPALTLPQVRYGLSLLLARG